MPRFVVLEHRMPASSHRSHHWDLMLEHHGTLKTWALADHPLQAGETSGQQLADHRLDYLDYQGPVSGDRGDVRRAARGSFIWLDPFGLSTSIYLENHDDGSTWLLRIDSEPVVGGDTQSPGQGLVRVTSRRPTGAGASIDRQFMGQKRWPRSGVIAVMPRADRLLVVRRSATVRAPGAYCFPGGTIEPGESAADALRREIQEELAMEAVPIRPIWKSVSPWGVELCWMLAAVDPQATWTLNMAEVDWAAWLTVEEMASLEPLLPSNREFLQSYASGQFDLPESDNPPPEVGGRLR